MNSDGYKYYSHSPEEWEKIDSQKNPKKPKKTFGKAGLILGINFAAILAIFLVYFGFNGTNVVKVESFAKVGDFQIYITSPKDNYLSGEPLNFYVYLSNLSSSYKNFDIYSFSVDITGNSTPIYVFNTSNVIKSEIGPNNTILLYELKNETNLSNLQPGEYIAKILMNFDGKVVSIQKTFKYSSVIFASMFSENDFFVEGQSANLSLYVQNNTPNTVNLDVKKLSFTLSSMKKIIVQNEIPMNASFSIQSGQQDLLYEYKTPPLNPGIYDLTATITGSKDLSAGSTLSVINRSDLSDISGVKIVSDIPLYVNKGIPVSFSISLVNNDLFNKKYVVMNSLSVIVKRGDIELYRFYSDKSHNILINPGGTRILLSSKSWQSITFPSSGTYDFNVIAKIDDKFINYDKKIQSL